MSRPRPVGPYVDACHRVPLPAPTGGSLVAAYAYWHLQCRLPASQHLWLLPHIAIVPASTSSTAICSCVALRTCLCLLVQAVRPYLAACPRAAWRHCLGPALRRALPPRAWAPSPRAAATGLLQPHVADIAGEDATNFFSTFRPPASRLRSPCFNIPCSPTFRILNVEPM